MSARRVKSYAERAANARRSAHIARVTSTAFFVLAGIFTVLFLYSGIVDGNWMITIPASVLIMAASAFTIRLSAGSFEDTAKTWDRLAGVSR